MRLVVVVDAADRLHTGVFGALVVAALVLLVPVVDTAHERGDQEHARFGAGHRLGEGEQQGEVGLDAGLFQLLGGADAFPGGGDLDQHTLAADAGLLVEADQPLAALDHRLGVERKACIHLGGDASGDQFEDLLAHRHGEQVTGQADIALALLHGVAQVLGIARHRSRLEQQ